MVAWVSVVLTGALAIGAEREAAAGRGVQQRGPQSLTAFVDKVIEAVDASDEQAEQLEAIAKEHDVAVAEMRAAHPEVSEEDQAKVKELHNQVRAARRAGDNDEVERLRAEIHEIMGADPRTLLKDTHEKIAAVLTPEQLPAFQELVREQRGGRGDRGQFGRGGRGRGAGRDRGFGIERFIERVIEETDATPEQQDQLEGIATEHTESAAAARKEAMAAREANADRIQELREEMREAMQDGDNEGVQEIRTQMRELMGAPRQELLDATLAKIANVLTEEQKPAYEELVTEMKDRMAQRPALDGRGPRNRAEGRNRGGHGFGHRGPRQAQTEDDGSDDQK